MLRFASCSLFSAAIAIALWGICLTATGCRMRPSATSEGALSIPPSGQVRVVSRRIEQTPERVHWKWSVIGERNWKEPAATETSFGLTKSYTLNDPTTSGGCNIWECDLVAESVVSAAGGKPALRWKTTIHGSDGATRQGAGTVSLNDHQPVENAVQIQTDQDALLRLPAQTVLARIAGSGDITLTIAAD